MNYQPGQGTPFIGRVGELAEITGLLKTPACRLLTLVGPGGIGKTRLAAQTTLHLQHYFADGACFVSLPAVTSADLFAPALAGALEPSLVGQIDPAQQLFDHLQDRELLLVLDNVEQLLAAEAEAAGSTRLITGLLAAAPAVKLLVTSQAVLNLQEEWLFQLQGLDFPSADAFGPDQPLDNQAAESFGAVALFAQHARRLRRDFFLDENLDCVLHICRLVGGSPLALELAAAWTKTLPCRAIAAEIERNIDFLTSNLRNVPARQRSMG